MSTLSERILFGLKVRQLRQEQGLSFAELSARSGVSVSFLNEMEKGKKGARPEKLAALAQALKVTPDWLISDDPGPHLAPVAALLKSNFLNELPLDMFGIDAGRVLELLSAAPLQINAFVSTLVELAQNHALGEGHFYLTAMRAYQELNNNYFPEIEEAARACRAEFGVDAHAPLSLSDIKRILINGFRVKIDPTGLDKYEDLRELRSVFEPRKRKLLLNGRLSPEQTAFVLAKEIGFHVLGLKDRPLSSSLYQVTSFQEVLNNFKAGYFAVALMIEEHSFLQRLEQTFMQPEFDHRLMLAWMQEYGVSPDVLLQRFNVITAHWGLDHVFFHRLVYRRLDGTYRMDKELHLHSEGRRYAGRLDEQYCRRWLSSQLLHQVEAHQGSEPVTGMMKATFHRSGDTYLCLGLAKPSTFRADECIGLMIGVKLDQQLQKHFAFLETQAIPEMEINLTCERCSLMDCQERASEPVWLEQRENRKKIRDQINQITG